MTGLRRDASVRTCIVSTPAERDDAFAVRIAVFVDEQRIPREEEIDEHDGTDAIHCVAYAGDMPVGAGRLVPMDGAGGPYGKIGRMAVLASHRKHGIGAAVLAALEREGVARGLRQFQLSAQLTARGFYERAGYTATGEIYDDVGIPHITMVRTCNL
jgi:predicted GNAT family N-acyltransferase